MNRIDSKRDSFEAGHARFSLSRLLIAIALLGTACLLGRDVGFDSLAILALPVLLCAAAGTIFYRLEDWLKIAVVIDVVVLLVVLRRAIHP